MSCAVLVLLVSSLLIAGTAAAGTSRPEKAAKSASHGERRDRVHRGRKDNGRERRKRRHARPRGRKRTRHHKVTKRPTQINHPASTSVAAVGATPVSEAPASSSSPAASAPVASPPAAAHPLTVGFNDAAGPSSYPLQAKLGIPVRRMLVGWNQVQPTSDKWDWSQTDAGYSDLLADGLRPLLVAMAPPCWAHPSDPCDGVDLGITPQDPAYDGDWSEFLRRLASRYPDAVGIEIWNEQNLAQGFLPTPDPTRYTELLQDAYVAIKSVDPSMPVISGGLFVSPVSGPGGIGDAQFLQGMYDAGAKGYMDGIGIHIYPTAGTTAGDVEEMENELNALRAVRDAAGDATTPIWITEMGISTASASPSDQASDLVGLVQQAALDADVPVAILHRLIDPPLTSSTTYAGSEPGYGVFDSDGNPKPAACALSALLGGTLSC